MKMKEEQHHEWNGRRSSKGLVAAIAVLAVAFVVFAAVPAVANDSDAVPAEDPLSDMYQGGMSYANGIYTITCDTIVNLAKNVTLEEITFTHNSKTKATLTFNAAENVTLTLKEVTIKEEDWNDRLSLNVVMHDAVVAEDSTVSITGAASLTVFDDATLTVNGKANGNISGTGKVIVGKNADVSEANFSIDLLVEADKYEENEQTVEGDEDSIATIPYNTIAKVQNKWNLKDGAEVTIAGKLIVPKGTALTIEAGAELTFENTAIVEISGELIESPAENDSVAKVNQNGGKVTVYGNAWIAGEYNVCRGQLIAGSDSKITLKETGSLYLYYNNIAEFKEKGNVAMVVEESATLEIHGTVKGPWNVTEIAVYGDAVFNSQKVAKETLNVRLMIDGATASIKNYTMGSMEGGLNILDTPYLMNAKTEVWTGNQDSVYIYADDKSKDTALNLSGLTFTGREISEPTDATSGKGYYDGKIYEKRIEVSGSVFSNTVENGEKAKGILVIESYCLQGLVVPDNTTFTVGCNVKILNKTKLTVKGNLDASGKASSSTDVDASIVNEGGTISISENGSLSGIKDGLELTDITCYVDANGKKNYVDIDVALAIVNKANNGIKELTVLGKQTIDTDATVPADVTLTVSENATLSGDKTLLVYGNLSIANSARVEISTLGIGIDPSNLDSTVAAASVSGTFAFDTAYVANGAVLDSSAALSLSASSVKSLAFNVQGELWFTAYSVDEKATIAVDKIPLANATFVGWSTTEGGEVILKDNSKDWQDTFVVDGEIETLYAVVKNLCEVSVFHDLEIENVAIDDQPLSGNSIT